MQMPTTDAAPNNTYPTSTYGGSDSRSHGPAAGDGDRDRARDRDRESASRAQPSGRTTRTTTTTTGSDTRSHPRSRSHGPRPTDEERREQQTRDSANRVREKEILDDLEVGASRRSRGDVYYTSDRDRDRERERERGHDRDRDRAHNKDRESRGEHSYKVRERPVSVSSGSSFEYLSAGDNTVTTVNRSDRDAPPRPPPTDSQSKKDNRNSAPPGTSTGSRTMSYAGAVSAPQTDSKPLPLPKQSTSTSNSTSPRPVSSASAAAEARAQEKNEEKRLAVSHPPIAPSRADPRERGQGHAQALVDDRDPLLSNNPGQHHGEPAHGAPLPPAFPQQLRVAQQPPQQGDAQPISPNSPDKGLIRSMLGAVSGWSGAPPAPRDKQRDEVQRLQSEAEKWYNECKRLDRDLRIARRTCSDLENERNRLQDNARALQHELTNVQHALSEAQALSEVRGRELVGAQVFLTKADALSISDVVEKVNVLNEEIFQAAAGLAEGLVVVGAGQPEFTVAVAEGAYQGVVRTIGEFLAGVLHTQAQASVREVHPLIAQVALSCFVSEFCFMKLTAWYSSDPNIDEFLRTVYNQIRQNEEQAVSGRWRALLRAQIRPLTDTWKRELTDSLQNLLVFSGWNAPLEAQQAFVAKLAPIFNALEDLRGAIYEKYTSADLEASEVQPGSPFQTWMDDAYGDERKSPPPPGQGQGGKTMQLVACTTGIGLKKLLPTPGPAQGHRSRGGDWYEMVLPPKVCLEATLREALEPPPPSSKGRKRRAPAPDEGGRA
ncbi:hypothetical protein JR316_0002712 [Psilocybe cubensis]|uniref:Uncharacterized protein n=2 Tax=Psilocybe cubensis TaxID=181762 RepID=A0ACB8HDR6_PSICU|nr:hypothetical protein JR316_0002712 [Psilocybe cubensis]KAH9485797.1 hypothetical protein JR316_0002712 [Psilocybe cubensis]